MFTLFIMALLVYVLLDITAVKAVSQCIWRLICVPFSKSPYPADSIMYQPLKWRFEVRVNHLRHAFQQHYPRTWNFIILSLRYTACNHIHHRWTNEEVDKYVSNPGTSRMCKTCLVRESNYANKPTTYHDTHTPHWRRIKHSKAVFNRFTNPE